MFHRPIFLFAVSLALMQSPFSRALAAEGPAACAVNPAARQLDFWLGDWSVNSGRGRSTVHLSLDKCELTESWASNVTDHRGENTLAYNPEDRTWYGLFVDNHGRVHSMGGTATDGAAQLQGPARDENNTAVLKRVRVVRIDANNVQQIWEKSADNGATWTTDFKMEYIRIRP